MNDDDVCGTEYLDPFDGIRVCTRRPGHDGAHEDDVGHWWPTRDPEATW